MQGNGDATVNGATILLVDDDVPVRSAMREILEAHGFGVKEAVDYDQAIALINSSIDVALLDVVLQGRSGLEVLLYIQKNHPEIPAIMVSGYANKDNAIEALHRGAADYFEKPIHMDELIHAIKRSLSYRQLQQENMRLHEEQRLQHDLRDREKKLSTAQSVARMGFLDWDLQSNAIELSDEVYELYGIKPKQGGYTVDEIAGLVHPDDMDIVKQNLDLAVQGKKTYGIEYRNVRPDGGIVWLQARAELALDYDGKPLSLLGTVVDITERKQAEASLQESELRLRSILNNTMAVVYLKDTDGRYIIANRQFEKIFNLSMDEIVGKTDHELFPKDMADAFRENDMKVFAGNKPLELEESALHSDGLHHYISMKFPIYDYNGEACGVGGVSTDITERKRAEDLIHQSQTKLAEAQHIGHMGNWEYDTIRGEGYFSDEAYHIFGVPVGFGGSFISFVRFVHPDDRRAVQGARRELMSTGSCTDVEYRIIRADGSVRYLLSNGECEHDESGRIIRLYGSIQDISVRKQTENKLRASELKYRQLVEGTADLITRVDREGKITFVNGMANDVFGMSADECLNKQAFDFIHSDDLEKTQAWFNHCVQNRLQQGTIENRQVNQRTGEAHVMLWTSNFNYNEDGEMIGISSIARDITDRKKAENALKEHAENLQRFNKGAVGREIQMIELKKEINDLLNELDRESKYIIHEPGNEGTIG